MKKGITKVLVGAMAIPCAFLFAACGGKGRPPREGDGGSGKIDFSFNQGYTEFSDTVQSIKSAYTSSSRVATASRSKDFSAATPPPVTISSSDIADIKEALTGVSYEHKSQTEQDDFYETGIDMATSVPLFSGYAMAKKYRREDFYNLNIKMNNEDSSYLNILTAKDGTKIESYMYMGQGDNLTISKEYTYAVIDYTSQQDFSFFAMDFTYSYLDEDAISNQFIMYGTSAGDFYMVVSDYHKPERSMAFYREGFGQPAYDVYVGQTNILNDISVIMAEKFLPAISATFMESLDGTHDCEITYAEQVDAMIDLGWITEDEEDIPFKYGWNASSWRVKNDVLATQTVEMYMASNKDVVGTLTIPSEYKYLSLDMTIQAEGVDTLFIPKTIKGIAGQKRYWKKVPEFEVLKKMNAGETEMISEEEYRELNAEWLSPGEPITADMRRQYITDLGSFRLDLRSILSEENYHLNHIVVEEGSEYFMTDDFGNLWTKDSEGNKQYLLYIVQQPKSSDIDTIYLPASKYASSAARLDSTESLDINVFKNVVKHIVYDASDIQGLSEGLIFTDYLGGGKNGSVEWVLDSISFVNIPQNLFWTEYIRDPYTNEIIDTYQYDFDFDLGSMFSQHDSAGNIGGLRPKKVILQGDFTGIHVVDYFVDFDTKELLWASEGVELRDSEGNINPNAYFTDRSRLSTVREVEINQEAGDEQAKVYSVRYYTESSAGKTYYWERPSVGDVQVEKTQLLLGLNQASYPLVKKVTIKDGVKNVGEFYVEGSSISFGGGNTEWIVEDAYDMENFAPSEYVPKATFNCSLFEYKYSLKDREFLGSANSDYGIKDATFLKANTVKQNQMFDIFEEITISVNDEDKIITQCGVHLYPFSNISTKNYTLRASDINLVKEAFAEGGVTVEGILLTIRTKGTISLPKENPGVVFNLWRTNVHSPKIKYAGTKAEFVTNYCSGSDRLSSFYYLAEKIECTDGSYTVSKDNFTVVYETEYIKYEYTTSLYRILYEQNWEDKEADDSMGDVKITFKMTDEPIVIQGKLDVHGGFIDYNLLSNYESALAEYNVRFINGSTFVTMDQMTGKLRFMGSMRYDHDGDDNAQTESIDLLPVSYVDIFDTTGQSLPENFTIIR